MHTYVCISGFEMSVVGDPILDILAQVSERLRSTPLK